jgi:hypothetical protein
MLWLPQSHLQFQNKEQLEAHPQAWLTTTRLPKRCSVKSLIDLHLGINPPNTKAVRLMPSDALVRASRLRRSDGFYLLDAGELMILNRGSRPHGSRLLRRRLLSQPEPVNKDKPGSGPKSANVW